MFHCFDVSLLRCFIASMLHCFGVSSLWCFISSMFHRFHVSLLRCFIASMFQCFDVSLVQCFIASMFHCHDVSLLWCFIASMFHCFNVSPPHQCLAVKNTLAYYDTVLVVCVKKSFKAQATGETHILQKPSFLSVRRHHKLAIISQNLFFTL